MSTGPHFRVSGLTLSSIDARLSSPGALPPGTQIATSYDAAQACVDVRLSPAPPDLTRVLELLGGHEAVFHSRHAPSASTVQEEEAVTSTLAHAVASLLASRNLTVATAESLTGGLLASALTDVPGMSTHLPGGAVTYSIASKQALGVPASTISTHGVVSAETAQAMAVAARGFFDADVGVGITGVAGPDKHGEQDVGTVFVGVDGPQGTWVEEGGEVCRERLDRKETKVAAVAAALNLLRRYLMSCGEVVAIAKS